MQYFNFNFLDITLERVASDFNGGTESGGEFLESIHFNWQFITEQQHHAVLRDAKQSTTLRLRHVLLYYDKID